MQIAGSGWARGSLLWGLLVGGCAHTARPIGPLIEQGRANVLSATAELRGQSVSVAGVVTATGLRKIEQYRAQREGPLLWNLSSESVGIPYVMARDPKAGDAGGAVLCYFSPDALPQLARLQVKMNVVMSGEFQEYAERGSLLVLTACELD